MTTYASGSYAADLALRNEQKRIADAIAALPGRFGLRYAPGKVFRVAPDTAYISLGNVYVYIEMKCGDAWYAFSKGRAATLHTYITEVPGQNG